MVLKSRLISNLFDKGTFFNGDELFSGEQVLDDFGDEVDEGFKEELFLLVLA